MKLTIDRFAHTAYGTPGRLHVDPGGNAWTAYTIELPWRNNERNRSCIPSGEYLARQHVSPDFGRTLWVKDVDDRSEIVIHVANSPADLDGCIAPGLAFGWAADYWDGVERPRRDEFAVWNSAKALGRLLDQMDDLGAERVDLTINPP